MSKVAGAACFNPRLLKLYRVLNVKYVPFVSFSNFKLRFFPPEKVGERYFNAGEVKVPFFIIP